MGTGSSSSPPSPAWAVRRADSSSGGSRSSCSTAASVPRVSAAVSGPPSGGMGLSASGRPPPHGSEPSVSA
eukprot:scaffold36127_cov90-Isochrysis_galbana.AAC.2